MKKKRLWVGAGACVALFVVFIFLYKGEEKQAPTVLTPDLSRHPIYRTYDVSEEANVVDFGIQPLVVSCAIICEVMRRDAVLHEVLAGEGLQIRFHPFLKGADVNFFLGRGEPSNRTLTVLAFVYLAPLLGSAVGTAYFIVRISIIKLLATRARRTSEEDNGPDE